MNDELRQIQEPLLAKMNTSADNVMVVTSKTRSNNVLRCTTIGDNEIPFVEPNIHPSSEIEDIERAIQNSKQAGFSCGDILCCFGCALTVFGLCYDCKHTVLINSNQYGFAIKSGKVEFLKPGWHFLGNPTYGDTQRFDISEEEMHVNNLHIIRIRQQELGIGINGTNLELMLPGTHCRNNGQYVFKGRKNLADDIIEGPIKIITVRTGTVTICYLNGVAEILTEGRYAINSNNFVVGGTLDITQQNLRFSKHKVLLEGGINMLVEGLLTYQVVDVQKLITNVKIEKLNLYLEEIMKADLTKVFSTIHLEQISSTTYNEIKKNDATVSETRIMIYQSIMQMIKPQADEWGIRIINFQLESTQLADQKYSLEYEAASLAIARSKADLKAVESQNQIKRQKAETEANINILNAETDKKVQVTKAEAVAKATIMQAEANASAILKEGQARAEAADKMTSEYGQELALLGEKAKIAEGLKIHTLVMGGKEKQAKDGIVDKLAPILDV